MTINPNPQRKINPLELYWICIKCGCTGNWVIMVKHANNYKGHMLETVAYANSRSPSNEDCGYYGR